MRLLYFASLREAIGQAGEELTPPPEVNTVAALMDWLATRGPGYAEALARRGTIRAAVDKRHAAPDTSIVSASEVALFPPMTGG